MTVIEKTPNKSFVIVSQDTQQKEVIPNSKTETEVWAEVKAVLKAISLKMAELGWMAKTEAELMAVLLADEWAEFKKTWEELRNSKMSSYSKMSSVPNTVPHKISCNGCIWLKPIGKGRYGKCLFWRRLTKTCEGCIQKEEAKP